MPNGVAQLAVDRELARAPGSEVQVTTSSDIPAAPGRRPLLSRRRGAVAGLVAGAVSMATAELLAGLVPGVPSLVVAVGALVIALQPPGAKQLVADLFGTADKLALNVAVVLVALAIAAIVGVRARRSFGEAAAVFVAFGLLAFAGAVVAELDPLPASLLSASVAVASGIATLRFLLRGPAHPSVNPTITPMPDWARRRFLIASGSLLGGAAAAGLVGRSLLDSRHPAGVPVAASLPVPAERVPPLSADESLPVNGITPIVEPNDAFYRIDTALLVPQVDATTWQLKVTGMVHHPLTFSYADLLAMPLFEQYVTIACVSNVVGGDLVGNALWTGVRLKGLLAEAGVDPAASQIVGRSVDGFTVGFPTSWALDPAREPMVALGMNRVPLPAEHGYPARLIVPGLYGYVSATKWLAEVELTTEAAFDAYWVRLGWAKDGPILTQSRIDVPRQGDDLPAGATEIFGVAWAPDRGISRVEVKIDDGAWQAAMLSRAISKATWVQWLLRWDATPGQHRIEVRATDGTGQVQTAVRSDPPPDGARGHQTIHVTVH